MPQVVIVSPALCEANNGNWQTARRWRQHLAAGYPTRIVREWPDEFAAGDSVMIALHARRSAPAIAAWSEVHPGRGLAVVLTGTDLYRDIQNDALAQHSLNLAQALVVLQDQAPPSLPVEVRSKARVIFQSTTPRKVLKKSPQRLRVVMVGHLRDEKSPETFFAAARLLSNEALIYFDHIGDSLDPDLTNAARATMLAAPNYRWLGGLPHEQARRHIQRAHLLIHPSRMEGGAHVIMEAVASGTPVLASRVDGNIGMLGADYSGYFSWGDAEELAALIRRCDESRRWRDGEDLLQTLTMQCQHRALLFQPLAERNELLTLVHDLLGSQ